MATKKQLEAQIKVLEQKLDALVKGQEILWNWASKRNSGELK
jgi:hypothetical protein